MGREKKKRGIFVTLEGGEGSGKSTQTQHLVTWLKANRIPFIESREPGGTPVGKQIRTILLNPYTKKMAPLTELLLYEADRAQNVDEVIRPALKAGKIVVSDRFADSSTVYQGMCRGLGVSETKTLNRIATNKLYPDLVIILDIPVSLSKERMKGRRLDRLEQEKRSFHNKVRKGFLELAKKYPRRYKVINGSLNEETVRDQVETLVKRLLKRRGLC